MKARKATCIRSALAAALAASLFTTLPATADLLVYEPFDYPDGWLDGQGGALGTTGTWESNDTGLADGWRVHPGGELTGVAVDGNVPPSLNVFDGTVDNLPSSGGFVGMAGPEDRGLPYGTDGGTGNLDASIALDPSVTATFTTGATTWFSFVSVHAWDRNQGSPQFMIGTDTTTAGSRGLTMVNAGNGIGGGGGAPRRNLQDIYPQFFSGGVNNHTPGGYQNDSGTNGGGTFGGHNGMQLAFGSGNDVTASGQLDENGQPRTQTMEWVRNNPDGSFGAVNIVVGKIEWDADTGGEDVISMVRFLDTDTLDEAAFDALITAVPALSSRNWDSNKPNLDQSQFDTLNFSSLKFFVDEIRIATTFQEVITGGFVRPTPAQLTITREDPNLVITWDSEAEMLYTLRSVTDPSSALSKDWPVYEGKMDMAATPPTNSLSLPFPDEVQRYFVVEEIPPPPPPPLLEENFDGVAGPGLPDGWTTGAGATAWEVGDPAEGGAFTGPLEANSGPNCAGTSILTDYAPSTDYSLVTHAIAVPGSGATLSYSQYIDTDGDGDVGTIRILDADNGDALLEELNPPGPLEGFGGEWTAESFALPAIANGANIKIEFRLFSNDNGLQFSGFYIDDVVVTVAAP